MRLTLNFDKIRPMFGGKLRQPQVDGINLILRYYSGDSIPELAYILATAKWESAHTMQPLREIGRGRGKKYGVVDSTGKAPYGRGLVQLTWARNYKNADQKLGLGGRLAADYDLALDPVISVKILINGMRDGWFTGKKLSDYIDGTVSRVNFINARRIVNGTDRAPEIADLALTFAGALSATGTVAPTSAGVEVAPASGFWAALIHMIAALFGRK